MKKILMIFMLFIMLDLVSASVCSKADWNKDSTVNMKDFTYFANHYGVEKGDKLYHRHYDLNKDGIINMGDIVGHFADCYEG